MRAALFALVVAAGCEKPPVPEITGTLSINGRDVSSSMTCKAGAAVHIFVDITTPEGTLRFEDQKLFFGGGVLACTKLDRAWSGARRPNNSAYWSGLLAFDCAGEAGSTITGDLRLECGGITLEERAKIDSERAKLQEQKRRNAEDTPKREEAANGSAASPDSAGLE